MATSTRRPTPVFFPLIQGHQDAHAEVGTGIVVTDRGTDLARRAILEASDAHHAAHSLGYNIVGGPGSQIAGQTKATDGTVDDAGLISFIFS